MWSGNSCTNFFSSILTPLGWPDQLFVSVVFWPNTSPSWEDQAAVISAEHERMRWRCYCGRYVWQCSVKYCKICSKLWEMLPLLVRMSGFNSSWKGRSAVLIFWIMVAFRLSSWLVFWIFQELWPVGVYGFEIIFLLRSHFIFGNVALL